MATTDAERAYAALKERIVTTAMRPGSVIDEAAVVADLGLGRTPVREALKRLEVERLVVVLPRRGMYVAEVTLEELRQLEEVRLGLEVLCARLAVQRMTPAQVAELETALAERAVLSAPAAAPATTPAPAARAASPAVAPGSVRAGSPQARGSLQDDRDLHAIVWRASSNTLLEAECERLFNLSMRLWYLFVDRLEPDDLHEEMFTEILAAARTRDEQRAEDAVRRHVILFGDSIRRRL